MNPRNAVQENPKCGDFLSLRMTGLKKTLRLRGLTKFYSFAEREGKKEKNPEKFPSHQGTSSRTTIATFKASGGGGRGSSFWPAQATNPRRIEAV